jgi:hypothetical protein
MAKRSNAENLKGQSQKKAKVTLQEIEVNSTNEPIAQSIQSLSSKVSSITILCLWLGIVML